MLFTIDFWLKILQHLPAITSFIGIIVGVFIYKKIDIGSKYLFFYLVIALIAYLLSRYIAIAFNNNLILIPIFGFIELLLFSMLYHRFLFKNSNRVFQLIIGVLLLLIIIDIATCNPFESEKFKSYGRVIDSVALVFISLYYYWKVLKNDVQKDGHILVFNGIVLLFFLLNSIWFLIVNFLVNTPNKIMFPIWLINAIAMPLFYLYLAYYIWHNGKIQKR
ncbi:hypothetical protein [Dokdonia sp.]|uniref:hypothetical protein n=1 Tax=Dokdonia sp. TaxID=2024995 RepID=UPI003263A27C